VRKLTKHVKICIFGLWVGPLRSPRDPFEYFNEGQILMDDSWCSIEAVCIKRKKVTEQFVRKLTKRVKICIFGLRVGPLRSPRDPFEYFNGVQIFMGDRGHSIEAVCATRKNVTEQFLRKMPKNVKISIFLLFGVQRGSQGPLRVFQWGPFFYG